jgi:hypothetical protein
MRRRLHHGWPVVSFQEWGEEVTGLKQVITVRGNISIGKHTVFNE